jgi:uroporphyrinogen-III decarboxylase
LNLQTIRRRQDPSCWISGTDFGTQGSLFQSVEVFRDLYKPFYKQVNDWVHKNTKWKTFYHSCGAIEPLIEDMIDMGVDCLNPVQLSATGMNAQSLKDKYGKRILFWGGGVDTQKVLPFGTLDEVREQVSSCINIMNKDGGYVFATIHNIVAKVPPENIIEMYKVFRNL